jgi:hypothetical protein
MDPDLFDSGLGEWPQDAASSVSKKPIRHGDHPNRQVIFCPIRGTFEIP